MIIIYTQLVRHLGIFGISIYPFILIREKHGELADRVIRNHEKIHAAQQEEVLVFCMPVISLLALSVSPWFWLLVPVSPYYLWYGVEYLVRRIQYGNHSEAYYNISFEREAYDNEHDLDYRYMRHLLGWIKYL